MAYGTSARIAFVFCCVGVSPSFSHPRSSCTQSGHAVGSTCAGCSLELVSVRPCRCTPAWLRFLGYAGGGTRALGTTVHHAGPREATRERDYPINDGRHASRVADLIEA
ncbi:hypothetical protein B0H19DRAFT_104362 [Mycena capillaripes]|nr:hypothetical protein B0H19DRAFT_104362 [Mycena capillaripes]